MGSCLCATHHRAFDRGLFAIHPVTYEIHVQSGAGDLRLTRPSLDHLKALPTRCARLAMASTTWLAVVIRTRARGR